MTEHEGRDIWVIRQHPKQKILSDEDIVCAPSDRGRKRREDRIELTSGVSAVLPKAPQSSYVGHG